MHNISRHTSIASERKLACACAETTDSCRNNSSVWLGQPVCYYINTWALRAIPRRVMQGRVCQCHSSDFIMFAYLVLQKSAAVFRKLHLKDLLNEQRAARMQKSRRAGGQDGWSAREQKSRRAVEEKSTVEKENNRKADGRTKERAEGSSEISREQESRRAGDQESMRSAGQESSREHERT
jgi:hypothetical protein